MHTAGFMLALTGLWPSMTASPWATRWPTMCSATWTALWAGALSPATMQVPNNSLTPPWLLYNTQILQRHFYCSIAPPLCKLCQIPLERDSQSQVGQLHASKDLCRDIRKTAHWTRRMGSNECIFAWLCASVGHGSSASAPASAPQGSNTAAAIASAPAPGAVTSASVGRRLLAADLS